MIVGAISKDNVNTLQHFCVQHCRASTTLFCIFAGAAVAGAISRHGLCIEGLVVRHFQAITSRFAE
jgi:hypothetical protein